MRVAIYAPDSSDNQREAFIEDQVQLCCQRIEREGWQLINTYTDRVVSWATLLHPGNPHRSAQAVGLLRPRFSG